MAYLAVADPVLASQAAAYPVLVYLVLASQAAACPVLVSQAAADPVMVYPA
ncbi:hypothetical protein MXD63_39505 [Frankia sp. Cpl3]|nr:hypothetical protein [Frankia sp. Cpl3]